MNIKVCSIQTGKLPLGTLDDRNFPDTAKPYLPAGDPAAKLMFAYKISRSGGRSQPFASVRAARLHALVGFAIRAHLEPATKVGPALPEMMLYDLIIKFSPRKRLPASGGPRRANSTKSYFPADPQLATKFLE